MIACFLPGVDVADIEDMKQVNFPMVFFVAATMAIRSMSNAVGVAGLVSELMMPILQECRKFWIDPVCMAGPV